MAALSGHFYSHTINSIVLVLVMGILDVLLGIAIGFFSFAGHLFAQAFGLLFFTADQLSSAFLYFAGEFFSSTLDLILVHDSSLS